MTDGAVGIHVYLLMELLQKTLRPTSALMQKIDFLVLNILEHFYSTAALLSLTLISLKGLSELMIPGFEFCHWLVHTEHRPTKALTCIQNTSQTSLVSSTETQPAFQIQYWTPNRWTKKMNTTCIYGKTGISASDVRGKKSQTKTTTQHCKRFTSNKSGKNLLQLGTTATLGVENYWFVQESWEKLKIWQSHQFLFSWRNKLDNLCPTFHITSEKLS